MPPLTLGTAGHIDHGKTALVRALTGVDTDRLPEERARGISIELGYAALELPSGRRLSVVDVPGHERFVRTMVAGATGIDLFLMVVAADDGVMPQTLEHAAVLSALGVPAGVVAVTKCDVAPPDGVAEGLIDGAEIVPVSARTGEGLDALRAALDRVAARLPGRAGSSERVRLHVDRVFTIRGAGTVVTGTLWSGSVGRGDEVLLLPRGVRARVRGVQVHDEAVERADAGQRVAINLTGVRVADVARGDVVAGELVDPTYRIHARLALKAEPGRVMVHHGTREAPGRAVALGDDLWQLRLEAPLIADPGDRVVVRSLAPPDTLGGGVIVEVSPRRRPVPEPTPPAASRQAPELTPEALSVEALLRAAGHEPPLDAQLDPAALAALRAQGRAIRVGRMHFHADALADVERRVRAICERDGQVTIASLRDELGTTRKYAQALLEHLDAARVTLRVGDAHVLRVRRRSPG